MKEIRFDMYQPCTENPHTAFAYSLYAVSAAALLLLILRIIAIVPKVAPTAVAAITIILTAFFIIVSSCLSLIFGFL